jgi:cytochrome bd-type quinol oxidase subunit 2
MKYDPLVYFALGAFVFVVLMAAIVLIRTPEAGDLDTRKIRFAAAILTGILMLFVFTATLYFDDQQGRGKEIFTATLTAMTPLVGVLIGYFFGKAKTE